MRAISTRGISSRSDPDLIEVMGLRRSPSHGVAHDLASHRRGGTGGSSQNARRREFERGAPIDQQSTTDCARPASLVSLYLPFMSFAVCASASTVSSKLIRCRDAISLLAIA